MYQKPNKRLAGQTAIVTGSSSGIGEAVALALGKEGANIVVNYASDSESAQAVASKINDFGNDSKAIYIQADVSVETQVRQMFQMAIDTFGTVDILVANAGLQRDSSFEEMTLAQWQKVIDVNLTGQFLCAREAVREFLRRGMRPDTSSALGKIIHMSSVHQVIPWAGHANYAASKGGIDMLMQTLAQEYGPKKIRVNAIAPGAIQTPINKSAWGSTTGMQKLLTLIPYGRIGQPSDIGSVAAWLASDESDYITGTTIFVDGGMTCYPGFATNG